MKKVTLLILGLVFLGSAVSCAVAPGADEFNFSAADGFGEWTMVKLYYAKSVRSGFYLYDLEGYVEIEDAGEDKAVTVVWNDGREDWPEVSAEYYTTLSDGKEVWKFVIEDLDVRVGYDGELLDFAIKYEVNGQEYWDNNDWQNYTLLTDQKIVFGRSQVALNYAYYTEGTSYNPYPPQFSAEIVVKDIAFEKEVRVVYSTNDWVEVLEGYAVYRYDDGDDGEVWEFNTNFESSVSNIKFAIAYNYDGITVWDNNFEADYEINGRETIH